MMAEVTEFETLFWLSLSALPACYDPPLGWLGSMWACVQACVCTGIFFFFLVCAFAWVIVFHVCLSVQCAHV